MMKSLGRFFSVACCARAGPLSCSICGLFTSVAFVLSRHRYGGGADMWWRHVTRLKLSLEESRRICWYVGGLVAHTLQCRLPCKQLGQSRSCRSRSLSLSTPFGVTRARTHTHTHTRARTCWPQPSSCRLRARMQSVNRLVYRSETPWIRGRLYVRLAASSKIC
jgi:hypothetical protein